MRYLLSLLAVALAAPAATAQTSLPRFGVAFQGMLAVPDGLGVGARVRAASALNADISLALGLGVTAFIAGSGDRADYAFEPQVSAIINVGEGRFRDPVGQASNAYVIAGIGAYLPAGSEKSSGGATLHGGVGFVQPLNTTSLFYEFNPALVVRGKNDVGFLFPVRVGLIF
ncbi:MAG: hypothetical protein IAE99_12120 [Rhodothermales bacterium]|nr:hypothetical protein [Rhodothermales bacterium]MCA0268625.1 hypothetical protein [Bacteroidota bacterium]